MHVNARAIIERKAPAGGAPAGGTPFGGASSSETTAGVEIVIQTRDKPQEGGRSIELPGGRVEEYESFFEALKREVREETGLEVTSVEGLGTRINARTETTDVECFQPFAVYQTTRGPVDSMGVYFHCQAEGSLLATGDATLSPRWVPVERVAAWMKEDPSQFGWVDRAGLLFYLKQIGLSLPSTET